MIISRKVWGIGLILILSSTVFYKYFYPHPAIGEWEKQFAIVDNLTHLLEGNKTPFKPIKLWVFKDNTAVYQNYGHKAHCSWSEKTSDFIVLVCKNFLLKDNSVILNFKVNPDETGNLDTDDTLVMVRTPPPAQQQKDI